MRNNVSASKQFVGIVNKNVVNQGSRSSIHTRRFVHCWNKISASKGEQKILAYLGCFTLKVLLRRNFDFFFFFTFRDRYRPIITHAKFEFEIPIENPLFRCMFFVNERPP